MASKQNLELHGQQWRVIVRVPTAARPIIGKANFKESLGTANLATANLLKPPIVARFKAQIEEALRNTTPNGAFDEAQAIRAARRNAPKRYATYSVIDRLGRETEVEAEEDDEAFNAVREAEQLEERLGEEAAAAFADIALSRATPIADHRDAFVGDRDYQPKSLLELDRTLARPKEWLSSTGRRTTLEAVSPEVGTAYMRHLIHVQGLSTKSAAKYLSFLRSYWAWLAEHHHLPASSAPWAARLPKPRGLGRHTDQEPDEGVGHGDGLTDTLRMTLGVYPGKSADAALRACVAAAQLPR